MYPTNVILFIYEELRMMWKEMVVTSFEALSQNLSKETEERHEGSSRCPVQESSPEPSNYDVEFVST
jgi:hypothetical protein